MTPSEEWNRLTLLEKLRKLNVGEFQPGLYADAADRIEQLHMELIKAGELLDADLLARAVKAEAEIERLRAECDNTLKWVHTLQDEVAGLSDDLKSAVEVAWNHGATEWVRLNYPRHPVLKQKQPG